MTGKQLQQILSTMSEADLDNEVLINDPYETGSGEEFISVSYHDEYKNDFNEKHLVLVLKA